MQRQLGVLVVAELLGRVRSENDQKLFLVKGGSSIEMRLGIPSTRTSKDLDAVFRGDFTQMYDAARNTLEAGWNGFTAVTTPPETIEVPGSPTKPRRFRVKLSFKGQSWCTVPVEVSPAEASSADNVDMVSPAPFAEVGLASLGLPEVEPVACLPLRYQIAQKLHACTAPAPEPRRNDRAHDLIDILLLWPLVPTEEYDVVHKACVEIFTARSGHSWPPEMVVHAHWAVLYERELATMLEVGDIPGNVQDAATAVAEIVGSIDAAGVTGPG